MKSPVLVGNRGNQGVLTCVAPHHECHRSRSYVVTAVFDVVELHMMCGRPNAAAAAHAVDAAGIAREKAEKAQDACVAAPVRKHLLSYVSLVWRGSLAQGKEAVLKMCSR